MQLTHLDFSGNQYLAGGLPLGLPALPQLKYFNASRTELAGSLPHNLTRLAVLDLSWTSLTGIYLSVCANLANIDPKRLPVRLQAPCQRRGLMARLRL